MRRPARDFLRQATAIVAMAAVLGSPQRAWATPITLAGWDFNGYSNYGASPATPNTTAPNLSVVGLTREAGVGTGGSAASNAWGGTTWDGKSLTFSFTADAGYSISFDSFAAYNVRRSSTGATSGQWQYQVGSGPFTNIGSVIVWGGTSSSGNAQSAITLSGIPDLQNVAAGGTITFRLNLSGTGTGTWYLRDFQTGNDFSVLGTVTATGGGGGGPNSYWVGDDTTLGGAGTWSQTGGTAWRPTDDDGTGAAWDSTKIATFGGASSGTVTVTDTVTANAGLAFATSGYTLTGGTVALGGADAATNTITTDVATSIAITSALAGSNGLTKAGPGSLTLGGANTYAGGTTVSAGTLSVAADAALGDSAGGITLGGGRLELTSGFTLGPGRTITAATGTSSTIAVTSGTVSFAGPFTGSGNLDKAGAGTLSLGNASSGYSGTFTISAGTLEVTAANAFANATLTQTGGTLLLAPADGGDVVIPEMGGSGGEVSVDSGVSAVFRGNSNRAYDGRIRGQGAFKKEGNGILTLNADNDFTGNTRIAQGRLKLGAGGGLTATPQIDIDSGAIFDVADKSGFAIGTGQRLGGRGTVLGDLQFASGSQITFDPTGPLLVGSGTVSFAAGFGIGSIFGLDSTVAEGTYTLLNEATGGSISFLSLANVGPSNAVDLGGGKSAYFQQGSLQVVVVPEPDAFFLGGLGLALAGLALGRRRGPATTA